MTEERQQRWRDDTITCHQSNSFFCEPSKGLKVPNRCPLGEGFVVADDFVPEMFPHDVEERAIQNLWQSLAIFRIAVLHN